MMSSNFINASSPLLRTSKATKATKTPAAASSKMNFLPKTLPKSKASNSDSNSKPFVTKAKKAATAKHGHRPKPASNVPVRPLSAYNFFFRDERGKWLAEVQARDKQIASSNEPHRKTDVFCSMGKEIGARWKALPLERVAYYKNMAKEDAERYKRERREYIQRETQQAWKEYETAEKTKEIPQEQQHHSLPPETVEVDHESVETPDMQDEEVDNSERVSLSNSSSLQHQQRIASGPHRQRPQPADTPEGLRALSELAVAAEQQQQQDHAMRIITMSNLPSYQPPELHRRHQRHYPQQQQQQQQQHFHQILPGTPLEAVAAAAASSSAPAATIVLQPPTHNDIVTTLLQDNLMLRRQLLAQQQEQRAYASCYAPPPTQQQPQPMSFYAEQLPNPLATTTKWEIHPPPPPPAPMTTKAASSSTSSSSSSSPSSVGEEVSHPPPCLVLPSLEFPMLSRLHPNDIAYLMMMQPKPYTKTTDQLQETKTIRE